MLISQEITDISPRFELVRNESSVSMSVSSSAYGYYDEELGFWLWDGEIDANLGTQNYYFYQTFDRPLDADLQDTLIAGIVTAGSYYINYGQFDVTFGVIIFDDAAVFDGTPGSDFAFGSNFSDRFSGGAGVDGFEGAGGDDFINGGAGGDVIDGGAGTDTASYAGAAAGVSVHLTKPNLNSGEAAGDQLISIERIIGSSYADSIYGSHAKETLIGKGGADVLSGLAGNDVLDGGNGADYLSGGRGNDTLVGGAGGDILDGGEGTDTASYATAAAGVVVRIVAEGSSGGDAAGDSLLSIENLTGSRFNDILNGDAGGNVIIGGAGDDVIRGYQGIDTLLGGSGSDAFTFNTELDGLSNVDFIADYNIAQDSIRLDNSVFSGLPTGRLSTDAFTSGNAATTATHRIIFNGLTGEISFDADGSGSGDAVVFARVFPGLALNEREFFVF